MVPMLLIKQQHGEVFNILVDVVVHVRGQQLPRSHTILIDSKLAITQVKHIFEFVLPDWVVHLLELLKVVLNNTFLILFVQ